MTGINFVNLSDPKLSHIRVTICHSSSIYTSHNKKVTTRVTLKLWVGYGTRCLRSRLLARLRPQPDKIVMSLPPSGSSPFCLDINISTIKVDIFKSGWITGLEPAVSSSTGRRFTN